MTILKAFNPHELSADTVLSVATGRQAPLDQLIATVRDNLTAPMKQHIIVSAPRGYGKSFFLRYLQIKIREIAETENLPIEMALLPEELPHVRQPDVLLEEIKRTFLKETADSVELHWSDDDGEAWDSAVTNLDGAIKSRFGKKRGLLVAGIENFDLLAKKIFSRDIQAAKFRQLITRSDNQLMIVAASARGAIDKAYNKPIFKAFDEIVLTPWSTDEVLAFFEAQRKSAGKGPLSDAQRSKAQAVATFIGGTPRLATLIGDALLDDDPIRAADLLDRLVDELTPYYKERIEALPSRSQALLDAILRGGEQCSATELAQRVGARSQASIAAALDDLKKDLVVVGTKAPGTSEVLHSVTDRVFAHYYRKRILLHGEDICPLEGLVDLLAVMYSPEEKQREAEKFVASGYVREAAIMQRLWQADARFKDPNVNLGFDSIDPIYFNLLSRWSKLTDAGKYLESTAILEEGITSAKVEGRLGYEALFLRHLAWTFSELNEFDKVLTLAQESASKAKTAGNFMLEANALRGVWLAESTLDQNDRALIAAQSALSIARAHGYTFEEKHSLMHIAQTYYELKKYEESIELLREAEALEDKQKKHDVDDQISIYTQLAASMNASKQYEDAIGIATTGLRLANEYGDVDDKLVLLDAIGTGFHHLEKITEAASTYEKAIDLAEKNLGSDSALVVLVNAISQRISIPYRAAFRAYKTIVTSPKNKKANIAKTNIAGTFFDDVAYYATKAKKWPELLEMISTLPRGTISALNKADTLGTPGFLIGQDQKEGNSEIALEKLKHFATSLIFTDQKVESGTSKLFRALLTHSIVQIVAMIDDPNFLKRAKEIVLPNGSGFIDELLSMAIDYHREGRDVSKLARLDPDFSRALVALFPPADVDKDSSQKSVAKKQENTR